MYLFFIKIFWWDVRLQVWRWCLFILSWIIEEQIEVWESQRCWGWKGPLEVSLQQDHLEPISLAHIHMILNTPKDGDCTISLGNPCQWLVTSTVKKCSWCLDRTSFHFVLCLALPLGISEKGLVLCSLHHHFKNLYTLMSLLFFKLHSPSPQAFPCRTDAPVP